MKEQLFEYLTRYIEFCITMFKHDIEIFSQPWMYWWILVPAFCYFIFFLFKWIVITAPIWISIRVSAKGPLFLVNTFIKAVEKK